MTLWVTGDILGPTNLNNKGGSATSAAGFSTNTLGAESGNTVTLSPGSTALVAKSIDSGGQVWNVKAFGAVGNGVADDSAAIAATIAAVPTQGGTVYFPAGVYVVNSSINIASRTDLAFVGQGGRNGTRLQMGTSGVVLLNFTGVCSRIAIRDLWLGATSLQASGTGLSIIGTVGTHSDTFIVENVTIQNVPNPCILQYLDNSQFRNIRIYQTISGAISGAVCLNMNTCVSDTFENVVMFSSLGAGTLGTGEGIRIDYDCDTIIFINSQVLDATTYGWRLAQTAGSTGPRLCRLTNCYSESNGLDGFLVQAGRDVRLDGCHAAVNTQNGFDITGGDSIVLVNSLSLQNQQHGILVTGGTGVLIEGNTCSNNGQAASVTYSGIRIENNVTGVRVIGNRSGDFIFTLTNKQKYGLALGNTGTDFIEAIGNDLQNNTTGALDNSSPGTNNIFVGNQTAGASPWLQSGSSQGDASIGSRLVFTTAASKIVPGATSLLFRNNADSASNISVTDAGKTTLRDALYVGIGLSGSVVTTAQYRPPAVLFSSAGLTSTSTPAASVTSFVLKGGTLGTSASAVRITFGGRMSTQAGTSIVKFGATTIASVNVISGGNFFGDILVTRAGSTVETAIGLTATGTTFNSVSVIPGETVANDIAIDFQGAAVAGGTLTYDQAMIEYKSSV